MTTSKTKLGRRNFLLAVGAGGTAAAAAIVAKSGAPEAAAPADGKRSTRGYQISAHIRNYYRTTKV
jgi:hypothetical protein